MKHHFITAHYIADVSFHLNTRIAPVRFLHQVFRPITTVTVPFGDDCVKLYAALCPLPLNVACPRQFRCGGGQCVPLRKVCDGVKDCPDGRDESKCCECRPTYIADVEACHAVTPAQIHPLPLPTQVLIVPCLAACRPGEVHCGNGQCKPHSSQCTTHSSCGDSSEEAGCGTLCMKTAGNACAELCFDMPLKTPFHFFTAARIALVRMFLCG